MIMIAVIIFAAQYLIYFFYILLIYVLVRARPVDRLVLLKRIILSFLIGYLLFDIAQYLVPETRPYLAQGIGALISNPPTNNSFPSGHTFDAFTMAFLILPFNLPLGIISVALALLVALGRVGAHVHYPIDIVGGIVIAMTVVSISTAVFRQDQK